MGAGICSLNRGFLLNRDSLNQDLSIHLKFLNILLKFFHSMITLANSVAISNFTYQILSIVHKYEHLEKKFILILTFWPLI